MVHSLSVSHPFRDPFSSSKDTANDGLQCPTIVYCSSGIFRLRVGQAMAYFFSASPSLTRTEATMNSLTDLELFFHIVQARQRRSGDPFHKFFLPRRNVLVDPRIDWFGTQPCRSRWFTKKVVGALACKDHPPQDPCLYQSSTTA